MVGSTSVSACAYASSSSSSSHAPRSARYARTPSASASPLTHHSSARLPGSQTIVGEVTKRPRTVKPVMTESWDDDFLFQSTATATTSASAASSPAPAPAAAAATTTTTTLQRTRPSATSTTTGATTPTTNGWSTHHDGLQSQPQSRNVSSSSSTSYDSSALSIPSTPATSARTSSFSSAHVPPLSLEANGKQLYRNDLLNASLDSLVSSWSIDPDPTLTLSNAGPTRSDSRPPLPPGARHGPSTPRRSPAIAAPILDEDFVAHGILSRSDTPSLGRSGILTAEEYTEAETEEDAPRREDPTRTRRWSQTSSRGEMTTNEKDVMPPTPVPTNKKWKRMSGIFASGGSSRSIEEGRSSRRPPREIVVVPSHVDPTASVFDSTRLPRPSNAEFVVLGRRSRMSAGSSATTDDEEQRTFVVGSRLPHSSNDSGATIESAGTGGGDWWSSSRPGNTSRRSLTFAHPPPAPSRRSIDRYRETDDEGKTSMDEAAETTEAETSGDEDRTKRRMTFTPPLSMPMPMPIPASSSTTAAIYHRPQWTGSNLSFASSARAFGLPPTSTTPPTRPDDWDHVGADSSKRKRKLVKKRPSDVRESAAEQDSVKLEARQSNDHGSRPLLTSSGASMESSTGSSSITIGEASTCRSPLEMRAISPPPPLPRSKSLAVDKGMKTEHSTATKRQRARSATAPVQPLEKGSVMETPDDPEWLAVASFPLTPTIPDAPKVAASPSGSGSGSGSWNSPRLLRRKSLAKANHPPVTSKTQGEKRPSTFVNMLTRSASSLPLVGKRAPSPSPSVNSTKTSILSRKSRDKMTRSTSSSTLPTASPIPPSPSPAPSAKSARSHSINPHAPPSPALEPTTKREFSFVTRARAFSRGNRTPRPSTPVGVVPPSPSIIRVHADATTRPSMPVRAVMTPTPGAKPRLGEGWSMPRPHSAVSDISEATTIRPASASVPIIITGPNARQRGQVEKGTTRPSSPRFVKGHRPSLSLSAVMPGRPTSWAPPSSPLPATPPVSTHPPRVGGLGEASQKSHRPRTAMASERPPSRFWDDDFSIASGSEVARRNSLSDLKIPQRISSAQARIEEDLERVKQFAQGIEELKAVRRQYKQLLQVVAPTPASIIVDPTRLDPSSLQPARPSSQAVRRLEIDYRAWWEQADALVDLGDGTPRAAEPRETPGSIASRRNRCVSLAPSPPRKGRWEASTASSSSEENESMWSGLSSGEPTTTSSKLGRRPSVSSIEANAFQSGVAKRQREMLRGVLVPGAKGVSLPSRGPPSPRPSLAALHSALPGSRSSLPAAARFPATSNGDQANPPMPTTPSSRHAIRRVSRAGVSGIKEFLLRLRVKSATEELSLSSSTPSTNSIEGLRAPSSPPSWRRSVSHPSSTTPRADLSDEEEDWDQASQDPSPARNPHLSSSGGPRSSAMGLVNSNGLERMVLTTEAMPGLVLKVAEVKERCEECVVRLKAMSIAM